MRGSSRLARVTWRASCYLTFGLFGALLLARHRARLASAAGSCSHCRRRYRRWRVVFGLLATPEALGDVLFGPSGLAPALSSGQTLIDMSTVGPDAFRSASARLPGTRVAAGRIAELPAASPGVMWGFCGDRGRGSGPSGR
jgi:hypothetical protein